MMLGEMQDALMFGNLHIQRQVRLKTVFPINSKAKKSDVELPRFGLIKDAEDWNRPSKRHCSPLPQPLSVAPQNVQPHLTVVRVAGHIVGVGRRKPAYDGHFG